MQKEKGKKFLLQEEEFPFPLLVLALLLIPLTPSIQQTTYPKPISSALPTTPPPPPPPHSLQKIHKLRPPFQKKKPSIHKIANPTTSLGNAHVKSNQINSSQMRLITRRKKEKKTEKKKEKKKKRSTALAHPRDRCPIVNQSVSQSSWNMYAIGTSNVDSG